MPDRLSSELESGTFCLDKSLFTCDFASCMVSITRKIWITSWIFHPALALASVACEKNHLSAVSFVLTVCLRHLCPSHPPAPKLL
jgi:hypothetical protein